MHLTDCAYNYVGEEEILGRVDKGALISNGDEAGDAKVSLMWWDDGYDLVEMDGKKVQVLSRVARFRIYDTLTGCKIERSGDGSLRIHGTSDKAVAHPAYGADEGHVEVLVTPGPNCRGCGGE